MATAQITALEAVETLKRSQLPSIIIEGSDDFLVFRRMEDELRHLGVSVLPVGGREEVLSIYRRRAEFPQITVAFIADRDMWVFEGIPEQYNSPSMILTDGYSVENDLYRDGALERILDKAETLQFNRDLEQLVRWFAFELEIFVSGQPHHVDCHVDRVLDLDGTIRRNISGPRNFADLTGSKYDLIRENYEKYIRGKTLLSLLIRHLSYAGRPARHNHRSLMEIASISNGQYMRSISGQLEAIFA